MILTDTHTHLYAEEFNTDRKEVINDAIKAGVGRLFLPGIDSKYIDPLLKIVKDFPENCFPMIGIHPCSVNKDYQQELKSIEDWINKRRFYAIGEIGIDLYWDKTFYKQQQEVFEAQILMAKKLNLPIIIHCRNSFDEIIEIIEKLYDDRLKGIFHCFTGSKEEADKIINLGFCLGIGGVVTFKNAGLDKVVEQIDLKYMVLETDSPYLAPVPYRGKRNESKYLLNIAEKVAELHVRDVEEVAKITTENSKRIFGI